MGKDVQWRVLAAHQSMSAFGKCVCEKPGKAGNTNGIQVQIPDSMVRQSAERARQQFQQIQFFFSAPPTLPRPPPPAVPQIFTDREKLIGAQAHEDFAPFFF